MEPPIVYLDTQDYSRFGDVLRGKGVAATEALFLALEARKQAGDAIFAVSMPILSELLQYDADFRETTLCKATAVERLCGSWALAFPSQLIASEIVAAARERGLLAGGPPTKVLSSDRFWYPDVSDAFVGLRAQIRAGIGPELEAMGLSSRAMRRTAKKLAGKINVARAARGAAPQMARRYGLPVDVIQRSIVALLENRITPEQASHALFGTIAEPVKFVETYFEKVESQRDLPFWLRNLGHDFEQQLAIMRNAIAPFSKLEVGREQVEGMLAGWPAQFARLPFRLATDELTAFGINADRQAWLASIPDLVAHVPSAQLIGHILPAYVRQIIGLSGQEARIERSFGGDLLHTLYLPHVDLWRGDRRFSAIVSRAVPTYANRIVAIPKDLPAAIDAWNAAANDRT